MKQNNYILHISSIIILLIFTSCSIFVIDTDKSGTYTVKHFQQNISDDGYTEISEDTQILKGNKGKLTAAVANRYTGFTARTITQEKIAANGSTVVNIYYDRNLYSVSFETNGGDSIDDVLIRYGGVIDSAIIPVKTHYSFINWYSDRNFINVYDLNSAVFDNIILYAKWREEAGATAKTAIVINGISYDKTEEVYVIPPHRFALIEEVQDPDFVDPEASNWYKGVFRAGRKVKLSPFVMSKYEVTQELYEIVMTGKSVGGKNLKTNPAYCDGINRPPETEEIQKYRPVERVTWYDAVYFCNELTDMVGNGLTKVYNIDEISVDSSGFIISANVSIVSGADGYRLPTEAEWEFAARGGNPAQEDWYYRFSGHPSENGVSYDTIENSGADTVGWYKKNSIINGYSSNGTHQVGVKEKNLLGLYDMTGNVFEWCYDFYSDDPAFNDAEFIINGIVTDPMGPSSASKHVGRGGSWETQAYFCTVYLRLIAPTGIKENMGFRVVRSISE